MKRPKKRKNKIRQKRQKQQKDMKTKKKVVGHDEAHGEISQLLGKL